MKLRFLRWSFLLLLLCPLVDAQVTAPGGEEFRFVDAMRKQGFPDLALQYLEKLKKNPPSKEIAGEIPLEIAKTRLEMLSDEPDIARKQTLYADVRGELEKYLKANPMSNAASDVELTIVNIAVLQGRSALTQALMLDEGETQETAERQKARNLLKQAGNELQQVEKKAAERLKNLPEPTTNTQRAERDRLANTLLQARFDVALNYFDQAQTHARNGKKEQIAARNKLIDLCAKELEQFVGLPTNNPIKWRAFAWLGRCLHEQGELPKARERYNAILSLGLREPAAAEGARLAAYFLLLVIDEKPDTGENRQTIVESSAAKWVTTYSRFLNTPEGCGVRYLQAKYMIERAGAAKDAKDKTAILQQARKILTGLEATENDYTDRARRKKIQIIAQQGAFSKSVADLKTFEDCYVRSQYEQYEMEKDEEKLRDKDKLEGKALETALESARKKRLATICEALDRGLGLPDAKDKANLNEANNARTMLSFYYLNDQKYADCIRIARKFAEDDPRSGQALKCAAYALQAYAVMPKKTAEDNEEMIKFARYCKERWKKELPGNLARHQLAVHYLGQKMAEEAIAELDGLTPDYAAYPQTQFLLVDTLSNLARALEQDKAEEIRKKIIAAIERTAEPVGTEGAPYKAYFFLRCRLADEMYNSKQYDRTEAIAEEVEKKLPTVELDPDKAANEENVKYFTDRVSMSKAYSRYGRANLAMEKNDMAKVSEMLDPIVDGINAKKMEALKSNPNLANAILNMSMKASIQQGKLDRTRLSVQAFQSLNDQAGDVPPILRQLVGLIRGQIDDLNKKGNQEALGKAITGFSAILDDLTKKQEKVNPEFQLLVAACYTSMTLYDKAVETLGKVSPPPEGTDDKAREMQLYREIQIQICKAQRLATKFDDANATMKSIMGDKDKPGWGRKNLGALKEQTYLYMDQKDFASAYSVAAQVSGALLKGAENDPKIRGEYIEAYFNMTFSMVRLALAQKRADQKKVALDNAAQAIVSLEKRYPDFGGDLAVAQKFKDLIESDEDFKKAYETLKMKK